MLGDQGFFLPVSFSVVGFVCGFCGFFLCVFFVVVVFSLLNFGFAPDKRSSHQGGRKEGLGFFAWWVWFFVVFFVHSFFFVCFAFTLQLSSNWQREDF